MQKLTENKIPGALPCPTCGTSKLSVGNSPGGFFWVYCPNCHMRKHQATREDAITEWNRRLI